MKKKIDKIDYVLEYENLPASFHGCRIGFLSDLHNNQIGQDNKLLLQALEEGHFEYLICGGDMIVGEEDFEQDHVISLLAKVAKKCPVYYGMGNHEEKVRDLNEENRATLVEYLKKLKKAGITVLDNESVLLKKGEDTLVLKGLSLDRSYYNKWWKKKELTALQLEKMVGKKEKFTILIAHNPIYFKEYVDYGPELVLSGHVHGGLMVIPGIGGFISPDYRLFPYYDFGIFKERKSIMILSRGLGSHTLPIRINNNPEITAITLLQFTPCHCER